MVCLLLNASKDIGLYAWHVYILEVLYYVYCFTFNQSRYIILHALVGNYSSALDCTENEPTLPTSKGNWLLMEIIMKCWVYLIKHVIGGSFFRN